MKSSSFSSLEDYMVDPHCPIANCSTHDLFNELHRRLIAEQEGCNLGTRGDKVLRRLSDTVDEAHHDYTNLQ